MKRDTPSLPSACACRFGTPCSRLVGTKASRSSRRVRTGVRIATGGRPFSRSLHSRPAPRPREGLRSPRPIRVRRGLPRRSGARPPSRTEKAIAWLDDRRQEARARSLPTGMPYRRSPRRSWRDGSCSVPRSERSSLGEEPPGRGEVSRGALRPFVRDAPERKASLAGRPGSLGPAGAVCYALGSAQWASQSPRR